MYNKSIIENLKTYVKNTIKRRQGAAVGYAAGLAFTMRRGSSSNANTTIKIKKISMHVGTMHVGSHIMHARKQTMQASISKYARR